MSHDDPVAFLNLREEPAARGGNRRKWWLAAILFLVVFSVGGVGLAFLQHSLESAIWVAGGGVGLGMVLCIVCATVSVTTKEAGRFWAALVAVPCLFLLAWAGVLFGENRIEAWKQERVAHERQALVRELEADPQRGLRERWFASTDPMKTQVFSSSLQDPGVRYNGEQLQQIYVAVPALRAQVLWNPACPAEVLTACLPDAFAEATKYSYPKLQAILQHRNTPVPLLAAIIQNPRTPARAVEQAMSELEARIPRKPLAIGSDGLPLQVIGPAQYSFDDDSVVSSIRYARFHRYEAAAAGKYIGLKIQSLPFRSLPDGSHAPAPRETMLSVPGMVRLMQQEDYRNVYFLPESFSFEGSDVTKLTCLATGFAVAHNKELAREKGEQELEDSLPTPRPTALPTPPATVSAPPARAGAPKALHPPFPNPAYDRFAQLRKHEVAAEGRFIGLLTLTPSFKILPDGRRVNVFSSVIRIIPGTTLAPEKVDDRTVYFMPVFFNAETPATAQQLELVKAFASEHNQWVLRQSDTNDGSGPGKRKFVY